MTKHSDPVTRIGLLGLDSSHVDDFLRLFNMERRYAGTAIVAMAGEDGQRLQQLAATAPGVRQFDAAGALVAAVDAVIIADRDGARHRAHALPCIAAGRPVFIDKPLTNSLVDAEAVVDAARLAKVPVLSGSALRWSPDTQRLKTWLTGLGGNFTVSAYGTWYPESVYGGSIYYAIHVIELVQELLGVQWQQLRRGGDGASVEFVSAGSKVTLDFRPLGPNGESEFGVDILTREARITQPIRLGDDYMAPVADAFVTMLMSGRSPLSDAQLLAPIRLMAEIDQLPPR